MTRRAGVLLHPTSLPGPGHGGTLGAHARAFIRSLKSAGISVWQILPLGPPDAGGSPYMARSAFALNTALVDAEALLESGWLNARPSGDPAAPQAEGDPDRAARAAQAVLRHAWDHVRLARPDVVDAMAEWRALHSDWIEDYALFEALAEHHGQTLWTTWPSASRSREPEAMQAARASLEDSIDLVVFGQFVADRQWSAIRDLCRTEHISIIGDIPIFVSLQSADVWQNAHLFDLDVNREPLRVAGVPPDYFSRTGQRWGNPLYRWDRMAAEQHGWWIRRFARLLDLCDEVRVDHFRGFEACWAIPASAPDATSGEWLPGPGKSFFDAVGNALGKLPIIAEDLGTITEEVEALRDACGFPGMKILQFAFGGDATNPYLPHHHVPHCVVYTGTHDNDTTRGWYASAPEHERDHVRRYLRTDGHDMAWTLLHHAWMSVADLAVAPIQDVLQLPGNRRMNTPGTTTGNWTFRLAEGELTQEVVDRLHALTALSGRLPRVPTTPDNVLGQSDSR